MGIRALDKIAAASKRYFLSLNMKKRSPQSRPVSLLNTIYYLMQVSSKLMFDFYAIEKLIPK